MGKRESLQTLYEQLRGMNPAAVPDSYEKFRSYLAKSTKNRQKAYDAFKADGVDVGETYNDFADKYFTSTAGSNRGKPQGAATKPTQTPATAQAQQRRAATAKPQAPATIAPKDSAQMLGMDSLPSLPGAPRVQDGVMEKPSQEDVQLAGTPMGGMRDLNRQLEAENERRKKLDEAEQAEWELQNEKDRQAIAAGAEPWQPSLQQRISMGRTAVDALDSAGGSFGKTSVTEAMSAGNKAQFTQDNILKGAMEGAMADRRLDLYDSGARAAWGEAEKRRAERFKGMTKEPAAYTDGANNVLTGLLVNEAMRMSDFDMETMMEDAWRLEDETIKDSDIRRHAFEIEQENPNLMPAQVMAEAERRARNDSDWRMYNYAVQQNMPKSQLEFMLRKITESNTLVQIAHAAGRAASGGKKGDLGASAMAMQTYGDKHKAADIAGTVLGMSADVLTMFPAGWAGKAASWAATRLAGRIGATMLKQGGSRMMVSAAERAAAGNIWARIGIGAAGGAGNFAAFEGIKDTMGQLERGGAAAGPDDSEREQMLGVRDGGFDFSTVAQSYAHGAMMGGFTGWLGPVTGKAGEAASRALESTAAKAVARAGIFNAGVLAEGTIFAIPDWIDGQKDGWDAWLDSVALMYGFKAWGGVKSAPKRIQDLAASAEGRKGMQTRLREMLDNQEGAMRGDMYALSDMEDEELRLNGYSLESIVRNMEEHEKRNPDSKDGCEELQRLMNDTEVSQAARAKLYYQATGKKLPMDAVLKSDVVLVAEPEEDTAAFWVRSHGAHGVVTCRSYKATEKDENGDYVLPKAARLELERINRSAELNVVAVAEDAVKDKKLDDRTWFACCEVARETGAAANGIYAILANASKKKSDDLQEAERIVIGKVSKKMKEMDDGVDEAARIRREVEQSSGVEIDASLRKNMKRRSEKEQKAIDKYIEELYRYANKGVVKGGGAEGGGTPPPAGGGVPPTGSEPEGTPPENGNPPQEGGTPPKEETPPENGGTPPPPGGTPPQDGGSNPPEGNGGAPEGNGGANPPQASGGARPKGTARLRLPDGREVACRVMGVRVTEENLDEFDQRQASRDDIGKEVCYYDGKTHLLSAEELDSMMVEFKPDEPAEEHKEPAGTATESPTATETPTENMTPEERAAAIELADSEIAGLEQQRAEMFQRYGDLDQEIRRLYNAGEEYSDEYSQACSTRDNLAKQIVEINKRMAELTDRRRKLEEGKNEKVALVEPDTEGDKVVVEDETGDETKDETKDEIGNETGDETKDETKVVIEDETGDETKDETGEKPKDETPKVEDETPGETPAETLEAPDGVQVSDETPKPAETAVSTETPNPTESAGAAPAASAVEAKPTDETPGAETTKPAATATAGTPGAATETPAAEKSAGPADIDAPVPMIKDGKGNDTEEPDFMAVSPERAHKYVYGEESGMTRQEADEWVAAYIESLEAQKKKVKRPSAKGQSMGAWRRKLAEWQQKTAGIDAELEHWKNVQRIEHEIKMREQEEAERRAAAARAAEEAPKSEEDKKKAEADEFEKNWRETHERRRKKELEYNLPEGYLDTNPSIEEYLDEETPDYVVDEKEWKKGPRNSDENIFFDLNEPLTFEEAVMYGLIGEKIIPSELKNQMGSNMKTERKHLPVGMMAGAAKGGKKWWILARDIWEGIEDHLKVNMTDQDVSNVMIDLLQNGEGVSRRRFKERRMQMLESHRRELVEQEETWFDMSIHEFCKDKYGLQPRDVLEFERQRREEILPDLDEHFDEQEYNAILADEMLERENKAKQNSDSSKEENNQKPNENGNRQSGEPNKSVEQRGDSKTGPEGEGEVHGAGGKVLSEKGTDEPKGKGNAAGWDAETEKRNGGNGDSENGALSKETSGGPVAAVKEKPGAEETAGKEKKEDSGESPEGDGAPEAGKEPGEKKPEADGEEKPEGKAEESAEQRRLRAIDLRKKMGDFFYKEWMDENATDEMLDECSDLIEERYRLSKIVDAKIRELLGTGADISDTEEMKAFSKVSSELFDRLKELAVKRNYEANKDNGVPAEEALGGVKPKKRNVGIASFIAKKDQGKPNYTGAMHKGGRVIATESHIIADVAESYDPSLEGKKTDAKGNEVGGGFPNHERIFDRDGFEPVDVDLASLREMTARMAASVKQDKDLPTALVLVNGIPYDAHLLDTVLRMADKYGLDKVSCDGVVLKIEGDRGRVAMMSCYYNEGIAGRPAYDSATGRYIKELRLAEKPVIATERRTAEDEEDLPFDKTAKPQRRGSEAIGRAITGLLEQAGIGVVMDKDEMRRQLAAAGKDAEMLRTREGEVYGFVKDGKIYLDPDLINPDTPLHEYAHLWARAAQTRPEFWARGKELLKESDVWREVLEDEGYKEIAGDEDKVASEVLARLVGRNGAELLDRMVENARQSGDSERLDKAVKLRDRIKTWLRELCGWVRDAFATKWNSRRLKSMSLDELWRMPVRDLAEGVNPNNKAGDAAKEGDAEMYIGRKAREKYEALLDRHQPDMPAEWKKESLDYLHSLESSKENDRKVKVALKWLVDGKIRLPQDREITDRALELAERRHLDATAYKSPADLLLDNAPLVKGRNLLDPDKVKGLSNKRMDEESGCVIYDVEDSETGQQGVVDILRSHLGTDSDGRSIGSPWCLSTFTATGKPTESARRYWEHYSATTKQIAFKDGKVFAFSANDGPKRVWWDFYDTRGIERLSDCESRPEYYGMASRIEEYSQNGVTSRVKIMEDGSKVLESRVTRGNGFTLDEYFYDNGNLKQVRRAEGERETIDVFREDGTPVRHGEFKNGRPDGVSKLYRQDGSLSEYHEFKDGQPHGYRKYYYENGNMGECLCYVHGRREGIQETYYPDGQLNEKKEFRDNKLVSEETYWENGNLRFRGEYKDLRLHGTVEDYSKDGRYVRRMQYSEGRLHGTTDRLLDGMVRRQLYLNGEMVASAKYDMNGKPVSADFYDSYFNKGEEFDPDGSLRKEFDPDGTLYRMYEDRLGENGGVAEEPGAAYGTPGLFDEEWRAGGAAQRMPERRAARQPSLLDLIPEEEGGNMRAMKAPTSPEQKKESARSIREAIKEMKPERSESGVDFAGRVVEELERAEKLERLAEAENELRDASLRLEEEPPTEPMDVIHRLNRLQTTWEGLAREYGETPEEEEPARLMASIEKLMKQLRQYDIELLPERVSASAEADAAAKKETADAKKETADAKKETAAAKKEAADAAAKTRREPAGSPEAAAAAPGRRIDDWGEEIAGARKHMFGAASDELGRVTDADLEANPLGKVFKARDWKKEFEKGNITEQEALALEAFNLLIKRDRKPAVAKRAFRQRRNAAKTREWVIRTKALMDAMKAYLDADPAERESRKALEALEGWSGNEGVGAELRRTMEILRGLGYPSETAGKAKIPALVQSVRCIDVTVDGRRRAWTDSEEEAVRMAVKIAKMTRGDTDVEYTAKDFIVNGLKAGRVKTGRYRVMWDQGGKLSVQRDLSREDAEKMYDYIKNSGAECEMVEEERMAATKFGLALLDASGEVVNVEGAPEFDSIEEARAWADENAEDLSEKGNAAMSKHYGGTESGRNGLLIGLSYKSGKYCVWKKRPSAGSDMIFKDGLESYQEAAAWIKENSGRVEQWEAARRKMRRDFAYFTPDRKRIGEDWRGGRDVTESELGETFGLRGVQFGNWTSQRDRQNAINEAYDALHDLAMVLGISPRALGLDGELGLALGARGNGGKFAAHYEAAYRVINLSKTRGAGSLAHEWWHALDNYFSRKGGVPTGNMTDGSGAKADVREEVRAAFNALMKELDGSDYQKRSKKNGEYWGRPQEQTARLFAEWVNAELEARGKCNSFLSQGASDRAEAWREAAYEEYAEGMAIKGEEPVSLEQWKKSEAALTTFPYPTRAETESFSRAMRSVFDAIRERESQKGMELYEPRSEYSDSHGGKTRYRSANPDAYGDKDRETRMGLEGNEDLERLGEIEREVRDEALRFEEEPPTEPEDIIGRLNGLQTMWEELAQRYGEDTQDADAALLMHSIAGLMKQLRRHDIDLTGEGTAAKKPAEGEKENPGGGVIDNKEEAGGSKMQPGLFGPEELNQGNNGKETEDRGKAERNAQPAAQGKAVSAAARTGGARAGKDNIQRQGNNPLLKRGNRLKEEKGEFCKVERVFEETGSYNFTAGTRIEGPGDVAYIFSSLEGKGKEHAFMVFVKNGEPTIVELGMGGIDATLVDMPTVSIAYSRIKPDQVYFVHNHPSGQLICSNPDKEVLKRVNQICDGKATGIIINMKTGRFGVFDDSKGPRVMTKEIPALERELKVYTFDKQVFDADYDPEKQPTSNNASEVAAFLSSHRLGDRGKISFLVRSRGGRIIGNIHTPFAKITNANIEKVARYITEKTIQYGGAGAIMYGDFEVNAEEVTTYSRIRRIMEMSHMYLVDVVNAEGNRSASELHLLHEPGAGYGESGVRFRVLEEDPFSKPETRKATVYKWFRVKDGELYPAMIDNPSGAGTPRGVALGADTAEPIRNADGSIRTNTRGRISVKPRRLSALAWRPDQHGDEHIGGEQFLVKNPETGEKDMLADNMVLVECEMDMTRDYTLAALEFGTNEKGVLTHNQAGVPYITYGGGYKYRTNVDPKVNTMVLSHAVKLNRVLDDNDYRELCARLGIEPHARAGGDIDLEAHGLHRGEQEPYIPEGYDAGGKDISEEIRNMAGYRRNPIDFDHPNTLNYFRSIARDARGNVDEAKARELLEHYRREYEETDAKVFAKHGTNLHDDMFGMNGRRDQPGHDSDTSAEGKRARAAQTAEDLNSKATVYDTVEELRQSEVYGRASRAEREQMEKAPGFYDTRTGEVVVVLENNRDAADVAETILHETVGHKGLRELVGKENYGDFLDEVHSHLERSAAEEVDREATRRFMEAMNRGETDTTYEECRRVAMDEYMARLAEKKPEELSAREMNTWNRIKEAVLRAIDRMLTTLRLPRWVKLGDDELRYMLWRSAENLRAGKGEADLVSKASRAAAEAGGGVRFRSPGSETEVWKGDGMSLRERVAEAAARLAANNKEDRDLRDDAISKITESMKELVHDMRNKSGRTTHFATADRKAESGVNRSAAAQRRYDRETVKRICDLARAMIDNGFMDGMGSGETRRLLAAVRDSAAGGEDSASESAARIMDIMIDTRLRSAEDELEGMTRIKGVRVDARGVEVQGDLDAEGQQTMRAYRKGAEMKDEDLDAAIDDALDRMGDPDQAIADEAAAEYAGLMLAKRYCEDIKASRAEERMLQDEIRAAAADRRAGRMTDDDYDQFAEATREAILQNRLDRLEAYRELANAMAGNLAGSVERAKEWREEQKQRVREIQHNANSDMEGRPADEHHKDDWKARLMNNGLVQTLLSPLGTFDQMLRAFGKKSANGEGYLWNRFMRGWVQARNRELKGQEARYKELDRKAAEVFGGKTDWKKLIKGVGNKKGLAVSFMDGGKMKEHDLKQGNLMYIYMVDKMTDGRMKLRKMGIGEDEMEAITDALDPGLREIADWLQEDFLKRTRSEYNEVHKRVFGASMAAIENYFPLRILSTARTDKEEDLNREGQPQGITTRTGAITKRTRNSLALDITNANALNVILEHVAEMEHWSAFAEWNRDMNTLRTYKRFRNQVINMTAAYGGGRNLWKKFLEATLMAAGEYHPAASRFDRSAVNVAKGVSTAKVSFRMFTALKQFLSMPAYLPEVGVAQMAKSMANPAGDFKWCMENMPIFRERWKSRVSGDPRLLKNELDWKGWRKRAMEISQRIGMTPNAFVDAVTVSVGARAMYETRLKRYIKEGYGEEAARQRAMEDATILFNQTQQSSEAPFLSTMQVDKSWLSTLLTLFRNSSMSYTRQQYDAMRNLARNLNPARRSESMEYTVKQILRDWGTEPEGATPEQTSRARRAAKSRHSRQIRKDTLRLATFGYLLQLAWNMGAYLPYLLVGDDDEEKKALMKDAARHALAGGVEGLTGGDVMSSAANMAMAGEFNFSQLSKEMPIIGDIRDALAKMADDNSTEAVNDIIGVAIQSGVGVNPQSITDIGTAIIDACGNDLELSHEAALFWMRVLQVPQSQLDRVYFDEAALSGTEASRMSPGQIAERYARYRVMRGTPLFKWDWENDRRLEENRNRAKSRIKDRLDRQADPEVIKNYNELKDWADGIEKKRKQLQRECEKLPLEERAGRYAEFAGRSDYAAWRRWSAMDNVLAGMVKTWLSSETLEEAAIASESVDEYRRAMVSAMTARTPAEQEQRADAAAEAAARYNERMEAYRQGSQKIKRAQ